MKQSKEWFEAAKRPELAITEIQAVSSEGLDAEVSVEIKNDGKAIGKGSTGCKGWGG